MMKNTKQMNQQVIDKIEEMCRVLRTNYQSYSIAMHQKCIEKGDSVEWHQQEIDKLCEGENVDEYVYTIARKYAKIIHVTKPSGQRSAHAFVDLNTGDVFKSASWKSPAKDVRYNLLDDKSRQEMYKRADWAGNYLYK